MFTPIKNLFKPKLKTLNTITINKEHILKNVEYLKSLKPNNAIFPVLKSNAYGHGILQMLQILKGQLFPYLVVDSFPEYQVIHNNSSFNILIMGETFQENYRQFDYKRTAVAVYNLSTLHFLGSLKKKINIHLFLNTGMNREGIQTSQVNEILEYLKVTPSLNLEGIMSHLYDADEEINHIQEQISLFKTLTMLIEKAGFSPKYKHIGASAGLLKINDDFFTAWRPGLCLYGYSPFKNEQIEKELYPALSLSSHVISIQEINEGEGVSYNHKRKSPSRCRVATIPFGYYEGWMRCLGGKLTYSYNGKPLEQLGTICMNLSSCKADETMNIGDEIVLISEEKNEENCIYRLAEKANTIPYEILIRLDKGIRREIK